MEKREANQMHGLLDQATIATNCCCSWWSVCQRGNDRVKDGRCRHDSVRQTTLGEYGRCFAKAPAGGLCNLAPRRTNWTCVLSAQLCTRIGKARTGKIVSAWKGRLGVVCSCSFNDDRAAAGAMMRVHFIPLLLPLAIKGAIIASEAVLFEMLR